MVEPYPNQSALKGLRVVEFEAIGPVPLAAMMLADMGADVVRIERPIPSAIWDDVGGAVLFRGRSRIELDLKTQSQSAMNLISQAHVSLEGMRPGVMERLGLGPNPCRDINPGLVYGRMTGWGQFGPLATTAGHDINYLAVTGALQAMGPADRPPPVPLNLVADYGGGAMFLLSGVLAATICARATGRGQVVDAAMTDGVAALSAFYHGIRSAGALSDAREDNLLDGAAPFYRCYTCADGKYVAVGALEPAFYQTLLKTLELDPAAFPQHDRSHWPQAITAFANAFRSRARDDWAQIFELLDACVSPVLSWAEAAIYPHNAARRTFIRPGGVVQPAPAPRFGVTPSAVRDGRSESYETVAARWAS